MHAHSQRITLQRLHRERIEGVQKDVRSTAAFIDDFHGKTSRREDAALANAHRATVVGSLSINQQTFSIESKEALKVSVVLLALMHPSFVELVRNSRSIHT
mmetsp:Transcript_35653/g.70265  ORF Transcript_35653/g.70265 Transcript_35653/m.70265 type:complete len:101 (-) Transcript_35653:136-438(-)